MKKIVSFAARAVFATMLLAASGMAAAEVTADEALAKLKEGNAAFAAGFPRGNAGNPTPHDFPNLRANSTPQAREVVAGGQHPYAIVLDCADSRLSPEIVFDKGLGELFVIRVAGNVLAPHQLGSIEYAVHHLGAKLIVVLGHTNCGAVNATVGSTTTDGSCVVNVPIDASLGSIPSFIASIKPGVEEACRTVHYGSNGPVTPEELQHFKDESYDANVLEVAKVLPEQSAIVEHAMHNDGVLIKKGVYDLHTGLVKWLD